MTEADRCGVRILGQAPRTDLPTACWANGRSKTKTYLMTAVALWSAVRPERLFLDNAVTESFPL